jgi:hypothetical protein
MTVEHGLGNSMQGAAEVCNASADTCTSESLVVPVAAAESTELPTKQVIFCMRPRALQRTPA